MQRQINYKTMRAVVGAIAFLLAPTVYLFADTKEEITSISISYWTNSGDLFVGALIAVAFFLFAYNGSGEKGRDLEFYLSKASCVFATCVALFPTCGFNKGDIPPTWTTAVANAVGLETANIHYGAAILLFACLIRMIWFFSTRAMDKGKPVRAYIYRVIGTLMVVGIISLFAYGKISGSNFTVLLVEAWGLTFFGIGWFVAGTYKTDPKLDHP